MKLYVTDLATGDFVIEPPLGKAYGEAAESLAPPAEPESDTADLDHMGANAPMMGSKPDRRTKDNERAARIKAAVARRPGLTIEEIAVELHGVGAVAMFKRIHRDWDWVFRMTRDGTLERKAGGQYHVKGK